jgi:exosortase A-associated hydrolase 2
MFLSAANGVRFCVYYPAAAPLRSAVIYLHPFAEEMNKSRRMVAQQSRLLAAEGVAVLQIDLFGCGDSSGDFGEADWDEWKRDVALALQWMEQRVSVPVHLWGLRLGALLALDFGKDCVDRLAGYVLWQPVVSGASYLTQFLRLRLASEMIQGGAGKTSTRDLRGELAGNRMVEVAGYRLAPSLAAAIDRLELVELFPRNAPVHWFEVVPERGHPWPAASRRVADAWTARDVDVNFSTVSGEPFWNTIQISECPELTHEMVRAFAQVPA